MNKAEKAERDRQRNSERILNEVRGGFSREPDRPYLVFECRYSDVDISRLAECHHPMSIVSPRDGREVATICFKRTADVPDYEFKEEFRGAIWRP